MARTWRVVWRRLVRMAARSVPSCLGLHVLGCSTRLWPHSGQPTRSGSITSGTESGRGGARLTPAERRVLTVQRKRRRREEHEADSTVQFLLAKRRLDACPGAADMVTWARAAARRCRVLVTSRDDRLRATRRSAIVADYIALRHEVEGAQHTLNMRHRRSCCACVRLPATGAEGW